MVAPNTTTTKRTMSTPETPVDDATEQTEAETDDQGSQGCASNCNEAVDQETRQAVLEAYDHRCQACGRHGPENGGLATLNVHHIERDPDGMDEHALENLTLLCRSCHTWFHQQSTPDDAPVEITEADRSVLLPQDNEILRYLAQHGPARTGDIAADLSADLTVAAVRERLWVLMGLDNLVDARDEQIVDKDIETGEWGLTEQIENSARGHIPDDPQLLVQRMEDEQVRQALERGIDRPDVIDVLDVSRRSTFSKHKRACAYDFPLDTFSGKGRPRKGTGPEQPTLTTEAPTDDSDDQQRLDTVAEQETEQNDGDGMNESPPARPGGTGADRPDGDDSPDPVAESKVQRRLQEAIAALKEVETAL